MSGKLYVVGTPIGNLKDISKRALEVLNKVDFILAEDTRVSLKLLNSFNIKKKLVSYNEFSSLKKTQNIVEKLKQGENAALISDAGMPLICDPGQLLINSCHKNKIVLRVVPGPCALIAAICLSGFNSCQFTFYGFLSTNNKNRKKSLEFLKGLNHTIILYEAPHKLVKTLKDLLEYLKDREIVILKELTKIYESYSLTTLKNALEFYKAQKSIKGEFVLVLNKLEQKETKGSLKEAVEYARQLVLKGEKKTIAAKKAALLKKQSKSLIYKNIN